MFYFICDFQKQQNTFRVYWLWFIFLLFRFVFNKGSGGRLSADCFIKRNHLVSVWNLIQKYNLQKITSKKKKISEYVIDETVIKVGQEYIWLWVAIEPTKDREILAISISKERNMFVAEHFLSDVVDEYGPHPVYTDGGSWYPQACRFLKLNHHIHSTFEKSLIERTKCSTKG
jgi:putative transposase